MVAQAGSGALAATLTTPFDVVKTRQQILRQSSSPTAGPGPGTAAVMRQIVAESGRPGLFAGLGPRLAKVSPACAIMIASFEFGKVFFGQSNLLEKGQQQQQADLQADGRSS